MLDICLECWTYVWSVGCMCGVLDVCVECWTYVWSDLRMTRGSDGSGWGIQARLGEIAVLDKSGWDPGV